MASEKLLYQSPRHLEQLYCGNIDLLHAAESVLDVTLVIRDNWLEIAGEPKAIHKAKTLFELLSLGRNQGLWIRPIDFNNILQAVTIECTTDFEELFRKPLKLSFKHRTVVPRSITQKRYLQALQKHPITLAIGPAGTGKTYLAVAQAVHALQEGLVERLILTRPAVEAGEALGFLPGDLQEKLLPYLRPLYDALDDILGVTEAMRLMEKGLIEIAPLAYMRGRTLTRAFVILDEAQNTTPEQMMMFLTRLGDDSQMVITGDITQIDLPKLKTSGLKQAASVLKAVELVKLFYFDQRDVVRHPLVQKIIQAYECFNKT